MMYSQKELKHCLECRWRIRQVKYYLILFLILFVISIIVSVPVFLINMNKYESVRIVAKICFSVVGVFNITIFCVFLPFILYSYNDYLKILHLSQNSSLHNVMLDHPHTAFYYRGHIYYTVSFMTEDKKCISSKTKPIWSYFFTGFSMEMFNNKEVEVLYNQAQNRLIVLGLKGWNKIINKK